VASIDPGGVARIARFFAGRRNGKWELLRKREEDFLFLPGKRNGEAQLVVGALIVEGSDSARGAETQIPQINSEIPATDGAPMHTDRS